ncbi:glycosyltransferase family 4 protein [Luteococcus sp. OSA5]|uniref:glycosyltransferase family 4 protein n=1 Tax=Luteococcus sp. OSA5 TaxID=3401630 RepID=UPI003B430D1C
MPAERIAYVVKVYPRFSETFVVTEILSREADGEDLAIYALKPTADSRFHPQLAQVQAPVTHIRRPYKLSVEWQAMRQAQAELPDFGRRYGELMPFLVQMEASEVGQAIDLAVRWKHDGITRAHVHFANVAARCTAVAAALLDIPFSVTTHAKDLFHDEVDPQVLREVLRRANRVIAISEYNRKFLLEQVDPSLASKVVLVRNGLELPRFDYRDPELVHNPLRVLGVGRLVEKKGFNHFVEAIEELVAEGRPVEARIVGEGEKYEELQEQIGQAGLEHVVTLLGARSQAELVDEIAWADVMAAPCIVGSDNNADGLPTVLLEAMASGLPCIATDVTGIPEAVQPGEGGLPGTGILLSQDPTDLSARLADALRQVSDPQWPRVQVARAARALVEEKFDTRTQARLLSSLTREDHTA